MSCLKLIFATTATLSFSLSFDLSLEDLCYATTILPRYCDTTRSKESRVGLSGDKTNLSSEKQSPQKPEITGRSTTAKHVDRLQKEHESIFDVNIYNNIFSDLSKLFHTSLNLAST